MISLKNSLLKEAAFLGTLLCFDGATADLNHRALLTKSKYAFIAHWEYMQFAGLN